jgi:hypothetical protein
MEVMMVIQITKDQARQIQSAIAKQNGGIIKKGHFVCELQRAIAKRKQK